MRCILRGIILTKMIEVEILHYKKAVGGSQHDNGLMKMKEIEKWLGIYK